MYSKNKKYSPVYFQFGDISKMINKPLSPSEVMNLPFEERQVLLEQSVEAAQQDDVEILEAFGDSDLVD